MREQNWDTVLGESSHKVPFCNESTPVLLKIWANGLKKSCIKLSLQSGLLTSCQSRLLILSEPKSIHSSQTRYFNYRISVSRSDDKYSDSLIFAALSLNIQPLLWKVFKCADMLFSRHDATACLIPLEHRRPQRDLWQGLGFFGCKWSGYQAGRYHQAQMSTSYRRRV